MEKLDRTGETTTNKRGQVCQIIEYKNNKNIAVRVIDRTARRTLTLYNQRYYKFVRGLIGFNAAREGDALSDSEERELLLRQTPRQHVFVHTENTPPLTAYPNVYRRHGAAVGIACMVALFTALFVGAYLLKMLLR